MTRHWPYKVSSPMKGTGEVLLLVDGNTKTVEASQLQWEPGYPPDPDDRRAELDQPLHLDRRRGGWGRLVDGHLYHGRRPDVGRSE